MLYLDANIFVYAAQKNSEYKSSCLDFLKSVKAGLFSATTSCETPQEIIHFAWRLKEIKKGVKICEELLNIIPGPLEINFEALKIYLDLAKKYPKTVESRDLLHLAVCLENNIDIIVTYDRHFKKFKEIKSFTPEEMLKKQTIQK
ncbi:MAG: type II toxin-antitoxin system VapC family toxin [Patescibacteria group bacterium]|nr:type II toxin-antitoxin system VapC family toxin [Patescibacteria group bacterium]